MNKTFKTLFTLFLGIFLIISTFTANSAESLGEQLIKLEGLYERGSITKEEFSKAKTILLKMDTASSDKIEEVKKELSEKEKAKRVALLTTIESEVNQTKLYTTTEVKKYASGGKNTWEKTEFFFDDYRVYAHRPGAIKIRRISDGKQVAILSGKFKIKYRNGGEDLFETKSYKENVLDKKKKLLPVLDELSTLTKKIEKTLFGEKKLPGKMILQFQGATILSWERLYVPKHSAHFFQLLALNDQPFHFYVVTPKGPFALNMAKFVHKIDIAVAEVKVKLAKKYNLTPEEIEVIIKKRKDNLDRQLADISEETGKIVDAETGKAIDSQVASAVDSELSKELEKAIGAETAKAFVTEIEKQTGQEIDAALEAQIAQAIDEGVQQAVSEGVSQATAEAAFQVMMAVYAAGGSDEEIMAACRGVAGDAC